MDLGLDGKVAIVSGSSRGIGRAIALALAEEGCRVVLVARGIEALTAAASEARGAVAIAADVTTPAGVQAAVEGAVTAFGGVDILVNNVGGSGARSWDGMDDADLSGVLERNLWPAFRLCRACVPLMRARGGGSIVTIASIWGREAGGSPSYNIAKAAEISLSKALARELASAGIRVNAIAPGSILFPGGGWERRRQADPAGIDDFVKREIPSGRFGTTDEVAAVATFLASARASWVTGACVPVDGGQSRAF